MCGARFRRRLLVQMIQISLGQRSMPLQHVVKENQGRVLLFLGNGNGEHR